MTLFEGLILAEGLIVIVVYVVIAIAIWRNKP